MSNITYKMAQQFKARVDYIEAGKSQLLEDGEAYIMSARNAFEDQEGADQGELTELHEELMKASTETLDALKAEWAQDAEDLKNAVDAGDEYESLQENIVALNEKIKAVEEAIADYTDSAEAAEEARQTAVGDLEEALAQAKEGQAFDFAKGEAPEGGSPLDYVAEAGGEE